MPSFIFILLFDIALLFLHSLQFLILNSLILSIAILTPHVVQLRTRRQAPQNSKNEVEPKEVHKLERQEQPKGDPLRNPAFILLRSPVQRVWAHS
jgi:hypothetical protein